jgi:hypothetical protein
MYHAIMEMMKTFKIRLHGIDLPKTVFVVNATSHVDCYRRFSGIFKNRGFYNSRSSWNSYKFKVRDGVQKVSTLVSSPPYPFGSKQALNTRSYYFMPIRFRGSRVPREVRLKMEVVLEVIELS